MTTDHVRQALSEVSAAVPVPPVDQVAFRARVRRERRRRTTGRAVVAAAASVLVAGALVAVVRPGATPDRAAVAAPPPVAAVSSFVVPFVRDGRLGLAFDTGLQVTTRIEVEEVLGATATGVVVVDRGSRLLLVPVEDPQERQPGGVVGEPEPLLGDEPVQQAVLSTDGTDLAYVDLEDRLHRRAVGATEDGAAPVDLAAGARLLAVGSDSWAEASGGEVSLHTSSGTVEASELAAVVDVDLARGIAAVSAGAAKPGVSLYDLASGDRLGGFATVVPADLSPDGRLVAGVERTGPVVRPITPGASEARRLPAARGRQVLAVAWQDDARVLVLSETPGTGERDLERCSAADGRCAPVVTDPGGTLTISAG